MLEKLKSKSVAAFAAEETCHAFVVYFVYIAESDSSHFISLLPAAFSDVDEQTYYQPRHLRKLLLQFRVGAGLQQHILELLKEKRFGLANYVLNTHFVLLNNVCLHLS